MLGMDDQIIMKLEAAMTAYQNAFEDIKDFIDKGKVLEKFQIE